MKRIAFVLPLTRFEGSDAPATRQALGAALQVNSYQLDRMIEDAKEHRQFVVNFRVMPEQFSSFLILRNDFGGSNWFAEMKPRIVDHEAPLVNKRIVDFTLPTREDEDYRIHDDMPQRFVDEHNAKRAERAEHRGEFFGGSMERYTVEAGDTNGPYDVVFGKNGRVKSSKYAVQVRHWRSGSIALQFQQPPVKSARDTGTEIHRMVDALMEPVIKERDVLRGHLRRAISILTNGIRVVKGFRSRLGLSDISSPASTFIRHGENLIRDAKDDIS